MVPILLLSLHTVQAASAATEQKVKGHAEAAQNRIAQAAIVSLVSQEPQESSKTSLEGVVPLPPELT